MGSRIEYESPPLSIWEDFHATSFCSEIPYEFLAMEQHQKAIAALRKVRFRDLFELLVYLRSDILTGDLLPQNEQCLATIVIHVMYLHQKFVAFWLCQSGTVN